MARSPFYELRYEAPFSGLQPLGPNVTIDSFSGQIKGKSPAIIGQYVMSVCIDEFRQGKLINIHRKDIHIAVSDCYALQAALQPNYTFCEDLKVTFRNELTNPVGTKFIWDFGDGSKPDTSLVQDGNVTHQYTQPGNYKVKLKADLSNGQCTDTTITLAKVWPGFFPGFTVSGSCIQNPYQFFDTTKTVFGNVVKWRWNFGDETKNNDTSISKNPNWTYTTTGFKTIQLSVESDSGCKKDFIKIIEVADKPPLSLKFRDTLICTPDALQLEAVGGGTFSWSPLYNIINSNTATPTVNPTTTTWYKVLMSQDGCTNND
ncbi:MAG: PKD domain-containing protein, partial [Chitinophagaceae bacterium]